MRHAHRGHSDGSSELHELGLAAAARAIRNGDVSSETYVRTLPERARAHADLKAFITIDEAFVLQAARQADRSRRAGCSAPLLGVPLAVKDSYLTKGLTTTLGTLVLADFTPTRDAVAVSHVKDAGCDSVREEQSGRDVVRVDRAQRTSWPGGQPVQQDLRHRWLLQRRRRVGGRSHRSGRRSAEIPRINPCSRLVVWRGGIQTYVGPVADYRCGTDIPTLDTTGLLARSVEDCALVDAVLTQRPMQGSNDLADLKGVRLAYAPRQHLVDADLQADSLFLEVLAELEDAGAELVEIDLGADFHTLSARTTWPIFFHETLPAVRHFLAANEVPVSFEQIYAGLGEHIKQSWSRSVVPSSADYVSDETYWTALNANRHELRRRLASIAFRQADALLFPTTPCGAPLIERQWRFEVGGKEVTEIFLSRNTHASSSAGVPGITLPMGFSSEGLPLGLELDAAADRDRGLLSLARAVEQVVGRLPAPHGF
jgi:Asp-tRNA(Asn)/Glu-tRNA(Gln) amidotransferase A subunit family amidase